MNHLLGIAATAALLALFWAACRYDNAHETATDDAMVAVCGCATLALFAIAYFFGLPA